MCEWKNRSPERREYDRRKAKEWAAKYPKYSKNTNLMLRHGIGIQRYEEMLSAQHGVCAICSCEDPDIIKRTGKRRSLAVDHCHETGVVRALLCGDCNRTLGLVKESTAILAKMIAYLSKFHAAKRAA